MECSFVGKRAIITGAGNGIGRSIAKTLYESGAITYAVSLLQTELDSLKKECPNIIVICLDVTDWTATHSVLSKIGPVDILVNNAGVIRFSSLLDTTEDDFNTIFAVNVKGVLNVTQTVAKQMLDHGVKGSILNLSSITAVKACAFPVYCASKSAVQQMTRCMAVELGHHQIRVNALLPTTVLGTGMGDATFAELSPEFAEQFRMTTPKRSLAEKEDVINAALYLLSDKADMMNGALLPVDGGLLCA